MREQDPEERGDDTPWAPSHLKPVRCCCHSPDAEECLRIRYNRPYPLHDEFWRPEDDLYDKCDCCCHGRDLDDEDY